MKPLPLDFLLACSAASLRDFELSRLNHCANLRKQIIAIEDELRQNEAEALMARWLAEHRDELLAMGRRHVFQKSFEFRAALPPAPAPRKAMRQKSARKEIRA